MCSAWWSGAASSGAELLTHRLDGAFFTGSYATGRRIAEALAGQHGAGAARAGRQGPRLRVRRRRRGVGGGQPGRWRLLQQRPELLLRRADLRARATSTTRSSTPSWRAVDGFVMGDPTDAVTYLGPLTRADQVGGARGPGRRRGGGRRRARARRPPRRRSAGRVVRADGAHRRDAADGGDARRELRTRHRDRVGGRRRRGRGAHGRHRLRPDGGGLHAATRRGPGRSCGRLDVGSAYWNCCDRVSPRLPWSGRGHSGIGTTLSTYGLVTFTRPGLAPAQPGRAAPRTECTASGAAGMVAVSGGGARAAVRRRRGTRARGSSGGCRSGRPASP